MICVGNIIVINIKNSIIGNVLMKIFQNLLNSKSRYVDLDYSYSQTLGKINNLVFKSIGRKINLYNKNDLKTLTLSDIVKLDNDIRTKYQKNLIKILKPEIQKITKGILNKEDLNNFHVGAQCKFRKYEIKKNIQKFKKNSYVNMTNVNKPLGEEFYNFPTVPHQDIYSVGFRSSSAFIFYFQITPEFNDSCLMQLAKFKNKVGIYDVTKKYIINDLNYVCKKDVVDKLKWEVPKGIRPGKIFLMDSISTHRSSEIGSIPRIALNVKIIPKSLNYIYKIYGFRKKFKKKDSNYNLNVLEEDLSNVAKYNNAINFELSILNLLKNNFEVAKNRLDKMCLFDLNSSKANKIFTGGLFRLAMEELKNHHVLKFKNKNFKIAKFSCADSILNSTKTNYLN